MDRDRSGQVAADGVGADQGALVHVAPARPLVRRPRLHEVDDAHQGRRPVAEPDERPGERHRGQGGRRGGDQRSRQDERHARVHHRGRADALDEHPGWQRQERPRQAEGGAEESRGGETQAEGSHHLGKEGRVDALAEVQEEGYEEEPAERGGLTSESRDRAPPAATGRRQSRAPGVHAPAGGRGEAWSNIARRGRAPGTGRGSSGSGRSAALRTRGSPGSTPRP